MESTCFCNMNEEDCRSFLGRFLEEFPAPLKEDAPLPVNPLSCKVSLEELQGESLEMGLKLLDTRYQWEAEITINACISFHNKCSIVKWPSIIRTNVVMHIVMC